MQITYKNNNANHRRQSLSHQTNKSKTKHLLFIIPHFIFIHSIQLVSPEAVVCMNLKGIKQTNKEKDSLSFLYCPGNSQLKQKKLKEINKR